MATQPRCDAGCRRNWTAWWVSPDDLDGWHLCHHHDTASIAKLTELGYDRIRTNDDVDERPQTLAG